ncbi:BTB/POZ domain-containing protein 17-like [Gigantopelta aegis]|uniref:BTB/POZ domain-containing protein 17-like n=1 Tax=Gigantopelta aegis TaxID=1735272 RepID=UPI001B88E74E|nr:BTB/POZ domain-containing protein 17-like [Gigantopelta aegis]
MLSGTSMRGKHINNSSTTLEKLLALYVDSDLSDVTLVVGSQMYHVHKLILSMCSDVLKTMLTDLKWPEAFKDRIVLSEEPECCAVFSDFVRYMYTGNIHLTSQSVLPILTLADKYNLRDLSETCVGFMCENCDAAADSIFVVSWLQYARLCSYKQLERHCLHYIEWNFQKVLNSSDFLSMRLETLLGFLHSSSLVVIDEYSLFVGVRRWLMHQRTSGFVSTSSFERLLQRVVLHIRFSKFKLAQLEQLAQDPFVMEFPWIMADTINRDAAPRVHLSVLETHHKHSSRSSSSSVTCCHYEIHPSRRTFLKTSPGSMPRNYLCEDWSTQLVVENFKSFEKHACRTLFFSTPASDGRSGVSDDHDDETGWDWQVDLYPRGIFFPRGVLIGLHENYLIDEQEHRTVRVGVIAKCFHGNRHVEISVLAIARGRDEGSEYVRNIVRKKCIFDSDSCLYNVDNVIPFAELEDASSSYLTGEDRDTFKIVIIIKPTTDRYDHGED